MQVTISDRYDHGFPAVWKLLTKGQRLQKQGVGTRHMRDLYTHMHLPVRHMPFCIVIELNCRADRRIHEQVEVVQNYALCKQKGIVLFQTPAKIYSCRANDFGIPAIFIM